MSDEVLGILPGITSVAQLGYNAVKGLFLEPIVQLTYNAGYVVRDYNGGSYLAPDGVYPNTQGTNSYQSSTSEIFESTSDYDYYFSTSVSGSGSYMSYSASASSSIAFRGSLFQKENRAYAVNFGINTVYSAQREISQQVLDSTFLAALTALPSECVNGEQQAQFEDFFDRFGTHYFQSGSFGCWWAMQSEMTSTYVEETSQKDVSAQVTAAFNDVASSGSLSVSFAAGVASASSNSSAEFVFTTYAAGGDPSLNGSKDDDAIAKFYHSGYANPILLINLDPSLGKTLEVIVSPLSDLIPDSCSDWSERVTAFTDALNAYATKAAEADGIIDNPKDLSLPVDSQGSTPTFDLTLPANCDQLVVASMTRDTNTNGDRGTLQIFSDSPGASGASSPTTLRAQASMHYNSNNDCHVFVTSLTTPVRKDDNWRVDYDRGSQHPIVRVSAQQLHLTNGASLGEWQAISIPTFAQSSSTSTWGGPVVTAETPGFLVANVTCSTNGVRGSIKGYLRAPGASSQTLSAAASAHYDKNYDAWVKMNGFCLPVPAGYKYQLTLATTGAAFTAFWIPVLGDLNLIGAPLLDAGSVQQAASDGLLVGMIGATSDGQRGSLKVYTADNPDDLGSTDYDHLTPALATTVDYDQSEHQWIQWNTASVPIPEGMWYRAVVTTKDQGSDGKDLLSRISWFPLVETPPTTE